jgi:hypothetical protein
MLTAVVMAAISLMGVFHWWGGKLSARLRARPPPIRYDARIGHGGSRLKRVYTAETLVQVVHVQNLLAAHGIPAQLRNTRLGGALGEIPFLETWPQLWVDDQLFEWASQVIERDLRQPVAPGEPWTCPKCGERIDAQFTDCWRCGAAERVAET